MSQIVEVNISDISDFLDVPVIKLFVKPGDTIKDIVNNKRFKPQIPIELPYSSETTRQQQ